MPRRRGSARRISRSPPGLSPARECRSGSSPGRPSERRRRIGPEPRRILRRPSGPTLLRMASWSGSSPSWPNKTGYPETCWRWSSTGGGPRGRHVKQAEVFAAVREAYGIERQEKPEAPRLPDLKHVVQFVYDYAPAGAAAPAGSPDLPPFFPRTGMPVWRLSREAFRNDATDRPETTTHSSSPASTGAPRKDVVGQKTRTRCLAACPCRRCGPTLDRCKPTGCGAREGRPCRRRDRRRRRRRRPRARPREAGRRRPHPRRRRATEGVTTRVAAG